MKRTLLFLAIAGSLLLVTFRFHSLAQANSSPRETLRALKEQNEKIIEQQTATLQKLDDVSKDAAQLRAFSKRA
jgi:hypothetical protein